MCFFKNVGVFMLFSFCSDDSVLKSQIELHSRPREICHWTSRNCETDEADLRSCVIKCAKCVETLTVAASLQNANQILLDHRVIETLQRSIRQLKILSCKDSKSFPVMCDITRSLVRDGVVEELCIAHCTLSCDMLKELLEFGTSDDICSVDHSFSKDCDAINSWTQDNFDILDGNNVTDGHGNSADLFDVALQPCSADHLPMAYSSKSCCSCSAHSSSSQEAGIQAFALINFKLTSGSVDTVLSDVLPRLSQLRRLALIRLTEMNQSIKTTLHLCRVSQYLCTQVQCGQLTHVIIDGCSLPPGFLSMLLSALLRRCRYVYRMVYLVLQQ